MDANRRQNQYGNTRTSYVDGNTVRKLNSVPDIRREERPYEMPSPRRQVQRQPQPRAMSGINLTSLLVLTMAIIATVYVCVSYLQLQTEVSKMEKSIITLENGLTTKINENDAAYSMINTACNLDEVYKEAVKLGMVYPNNNEVITYQPSSEDYVRQYEKIPD